MKSQKKKSKHQLQIFLENNKNYWSALIKYNTDILLAIGKSLLVFNVFEINTTVS